ncbi:MAG: hypothetical protein M0R22_01495 [Dehalococcoidia bacterium]|jgi:hypothetical protein|nr:hypothetical protein [Dehalococcoidia bacterium]
MRRIEAEVRSGKRSYRDGRICVGKVTTKAHRRSPSTNPHPVFDDATEKIRRENANDLGWVIPTLELVVPLLLLGLLLDWLQISC